MAIFHGEVPKTIAALENTCLPFTFCLNLLFLYEWKKMFKNVGKKSEFLLRLCKIFLEGSNIFQNISQKNLYGPI